MVLPFLSVRTLNFIGPNQHLRSREKRLSGPNIYYSLTQALFFLEQDGIFLYSLFIQPSFLRFELTVSTLIFDGSFVSSWHFLVCLCQISCRVYNWAAGGWRWEPQKPGAKRTILAVWQMHLYRSGPCEAHIPLKWGNALFDHLRLWRFMNILTYLRNHTTVSKCFGGITKCLHKEHHEFWKYLVLILTEIKRI